MRGGAQAHLLEAGDGLFYVTKFRENPQHHRILVNEWIAARLLDYLDIAAPPAAIVNLDESFLSREPEVRIRLANRETAVSPGFHFGSRFPGNPDRDAIYDYLPDVLLTQVYNLSHFLGIFAFDKWTANSDSRQAIFVRQRVSRWIDGADVAPLKKSFVALMIDHGFVFDGPEWTFSDLPAQGFYFRPIVYRGVRGLDSFEPWLTRIREAPSQLFDEAVRDMPRQWLTEEDEAALERLVDQLFRRCARIGTLIEESVRVRPSCFPAWAGSTHPR
jgi:hypothetical protein